MYRMGHLVLALAVSLLVGFVVGLAVRKRKRADEPAPEPEVKKAEPQPAKSYGPDVDAIIADGKSP